MPDKNKQSISVLLWTSGRVIYSAAGTDRRAVLDAAISRLDPDDAPRVCRLLSGVLEGRATLEPSHGGALALVYSTFAEDVLAGAPATLVVYPAEHFGG